MKIYTLIETNLNLNNCNFNSIFFIHYFFFFFFDTPFIVKLYKG